MKVTFNITDAEVGAIKKVLRNDFGYINPTKEDIINELHNELSKIIFRMTDDH